MLWFSKNKHMLEKERERDAIDMIKAKGNHIGSYEARTILEVNLKRPLNQSTVMRKS